jgi:hypothetical protein
MADRPTPAPDADSPEIEISDEMVAAGIKALEIWDSDDLSEWKVFDVYREMEIARRLAKVAPKPREVDAAGVERVR